MSLKNENTDECNSYLLIQLRKTPQNNKQAKISKILSAKVMCSLSALKYNQQDIG